MSSSIQTEGATSCPRRADLIVVGSGFAGMYAAYRFREMGKTVAGIEAGGGVGGVWYWNRYPGARCDVMSIDYSHGFSNEIQQEWTWSEQFAAQPEILAYANFVADRLDLRKHFAFNTRVVSAVWDDDHGLWRAKTDAGETIEAPYCVMATGPLSVPKDPDIPGIDNFRGLLLRAQKWPQEPISFEGKRVGVIGTGSTGIQIVQTLGKQVGALFVFQRTPSFALPMRNRVLDSDYIAEMKRHYPEIRAAMQNNPSGGSRPAVLRPYFSLLPEQRDQILKQAWENGGYSFLGSFGDLMTNQEANDQVADFVRGKIGEIVKDPVTAEALKPRGYPIFARRPCLDTGYYETYNLPNVHLLDCLESPIVEITEKGVRTADGETELDILVFATGYDALTGALMAFEVAGRHGRKLADKWKNGPRSYLGMMLEGFPNLFMTSGPNGPSALANLITVAEHDVDWIAKVIEHMEKKGLASVEPTRKAEDDWMNLVIELAEKSLIQKASSWWVGSNVKGKPQGLTMFSGGFDKYREYCDAVAQNGYQTLTFERTEESADHQGERIVSGDRYAK